MPNFVKGSETAHGRSAANATNALTDRGAGAKSAMGIPPGQAGSLPDRLPALDSACRRVYWFYKYLLKPKPTCRSHRNVVPKEMKRFLPLIVLAFACTAIRVLVAAEPETKGEWRKVLGFDVMATQRDHQADLGNHRRVVASWTDLGWEFEVRNYGDKTSENLLYDGHNWHGIQPWMVWAGTKHEQTYPDEREIAYDKGSSHLKIVLIDCQTKQVGKNSYQFVKGRIAVFHKP